MTHSPDQAFRKCLLERTGAGQKACTKAGCLRPAAPALTRTTNNTASRGARRGRTTELVIPNSWQAAARLARVGQAAKATWAHAQASAGAYSATVQISIAESPSAAPALTLAASNLALHTHTPKSSKAHTVVRKEKVLQDVGRRMTVSARLPGTRRGEVQPWARGAAMPACLPGRHTGR